MHVATTTKTTKNPSEKHQNFCQQESGQLDMCKHCTTCWNVFSFLFLINRTPSLLQHGRRHNPKAARKTMHNQLPHFACHMLPALSVAWPSADRNLDLNTACNKTRPYPVRGKFAFLIHVLGSISDCSAVCAVCSQLLSPLIIQTLVITQCKLQS